MQKLLKRPFLKVPFVEIEPMLNLVKNKTGCSESELGKSFGYSGSAITEWRKSGNAPLRAKYCLLGFATELELKADIIKAATEKPLPRQFDKDELSSMFGILIGLDIPAGRRDQLRSKIAKELA